MEEIAFKKSSKYNFAIGYAFLALIFLALPFMTSHDVLLEDIIVWSLYALGFNLSFGFMKMVSLGHGLFFGLTAYTIGILSVFWARTIVTVPIGIAVGTLAAFIEGYIALKKARLDIHETLRINSFVLITLT